MAWRFVRQPNGLLARFSEVVDDFTHCDMTTEEAVGVAREGDGYGNGMDRRAAEEKVRRGLDDEPLPGHEPRDDKLSRWHEALGTILLVHGWKVCQKRMRKLSKTVKGEHEHRLAPAAGTEDAGMTLDEIRAVCEAEGVAATPMWRRECRQGEVEVYVAGDEARIEESGPRGFRVAYAGTPDELAALIRDATRFLEAT